MKSRITTGWGIAAFDCSVKHYKKSRVRFFLRYFACWPELDSLHLFTSFNGAALNSKGSINKVLKTSSPFHDQVA